MMNAKFAMSLVASDTESLTMSMHQAPSDVASLQQFGDLDFAKPKKTVNFTAATRDGAEATPTASTGLGAGDGSSTPVLPNPFAHEAQHNELLAMFARPQSAPRPVSALFMVVGLVVGLGVGALLSQLGASPDVVHWVALPGQMYLDALVAMIVPAVFCSVVVSATEAVSNSTVRRIALCTALWFTATALLAAGSGTVFAALFASTFEPKTLRAVLKAEPQLSFQCESSAWLTLTANGSVACRSRANATVSGRFTVEDTDAVFKRSAANRFDAVSLTDQIVGILSNMVPTNILAGFVDGTHVSVIFTAFFFAIACTYGHDSRHGVPNYIILMVSQGQIVFGMVVNALLRLLPVAAISIVGGAIGANPSSISYLSDVGFMLLAMLLASLFFVVVGLGAALFVVTKHNVVRYLHHALPAQAFALGSGSTIATLPMTIRCVDTTGEVSHSLGRIVLSFGATCNLTGMSLYIPLAIVFLARLSGLESQLTASKYVLLWLLSAVAAFGAKTVESAEIVMVLTVWRVLFQSELGDVVSVLVATDWLFQRIRALVNVTTHALLARIVAEHCAYRVQYKTESEFLVDDEFAMPQIGRAALY